MGRYKTVITPDGVEDVPFTEAEEAARDAEEAAWAAGANARANAVLARKLAATDAGMVRVCEEIYAMAKGEIEDISDEAKAKIAARQELRSQFV